MEYGARRTDRQTDGKSDIKSWVPHLKNQIKKLSVPGPQRARKPRPNVSQSDRKNRTKC